jgi:hypothetical protein
MTTTAEILQKARDLISDEKNWTKGEYARNERGSFIDYDSKSATCFCSVGALLKVSPAERARDAFFFLSQECEETAGQLVVRFNDTHTHAEVLDLFDRAIKRAISAEEAA